MFFYPKGFIKERRAGFFDASHNKTLLKWARGQAQACVCFPLKQERASLSVWEEGAQKDDAVHYQILKIQGRFINYK